VCIVSRDIRQLINSPVQTEEEIDVRILDLLESLDISQFRIVLPRRMTHRSPTAEHRT
jgi:hypothetical protein